MLFRKKNSDFKKIDLSNTLSADRKSSTDVRVLQQNSWNKCCQSTDTNALPLQTEYINLINTPIYSAFF